MCRNIKTLFNFEPPASELEIRDASLQFVRKLSGFSVPSKANEEAFERAVQEVAESARRLIRSMVTHAEPKNREVGVIDSRLPRCSTTISASSGVARNSGRPIGRVFFSACTSRSSQRGASVFDFASK